MMQAPEDVTKAEETQCTCNLGFQRITGPPSSGIFHVASQGAESDLCGVTLAIVMELCRLGSFYKLIEQARHVAHLPPDVRSGAACPSTPDMAKVKVCNGLPGSLHQSAALSEC